jgi:hypothetical protein
MSKLGKIRPIRPYLAYPGPWIIGELEKQDGNKNKIK